MSDTRAWDGVFDGPPIGTQPDEEAFQFRPQPRSAPTPTQDSWFRADIQGLRMVAVMLVVLNHVFHHPVGGFIGVDVFFVISGYLITGLLLKRHTTRGRVSFTAFYKARARRILPAALVVLGACYLAGLVTFNGERIRENGQDVLWSLGFAANIHFQRIGTDYFQATRSPSLVQHFWSLAVEEQFYIVWPVVILLMLTATRPLVTSERARFVMLLGVIVVATAASFAWSLHTTSTDPTIAYFSTIDRAWELGIGAIVAVTLARFPALPTLVGATAGGLSFTGVLVIVGSAFLVKPTPGFPAPWAALPVLATALVIFAGAAQVSLGRLGLVLTNPVSVYIGLVSYSLYLWHWPVVIESEALVSRTSPVFFPMAIAATIALTLFSYHFIEAPFRSPLFGGASGTGLSRAQNGKLLVACLAAAVFAAASYALKPAPPVPNFLAHAPSQPVGAYGANPNAKVIQPSAARKSGIDAALQARSFPKLDPSLDHLGLSAAQSDWLGCQTSTSALKSCTFASGAASPAKVAMVLGDSISLAWLPAIRAALVPAGWTVVGLARGQCSPTYVSQANTTSGGTRTCDKLHAFYKKAAAQIKPTLVIMSSVETTLNRMKDGAQGSAAIKEYRDGMARTIKIFTAPGRKIVVLSPPPLTKALLDCDAGTAAPSDCVGSISTQWHDQAGADALTAQQTGATYLDSHLWFCANSGYCPSFVGTTPVRYDRDHITKKYAEGLGAELRSALGV